MLQNSTLTGYVVLALLTALVVSFLLTPAVKSFAYKVGAVDVPKDGRRMHNHAAWLVDHHNIRILINNIQRNILRLEIYFL